ncbi:MAG: tetratricopeptide repeat protein [Candidatus Lernaella stagnicola]|nr:tetratricopeptide repeat protein [Candidatus Lernaella stagnicola]
MPELRISLIWLLVMELTAVTLAALLYMLQIVPGDYFLFVLLAAVVLAAALFLGLYYLVDRRESPGRPQAKFEMARADEIDSKINEYMQLGRQLLCEERYDEAAKMFQEVLVRNARSWQAHNYLGRAHACQGRFEEAKNAYEMALSLEYNYGSAHFNLATAHEKLGELDKAADRWRQYIEVGLTIGERDDMLDHARQRIQALEEHLARHGGREGAADQDETDF